MYQKLKQYIDQFVDLGEQEWQYFVAALKFKEVPKKGFLLEPGQICDFVAFVNQGNFRMYRIVDGKDVTTNFIFSGNFATNYSSCVSLTPGEEYIQALEDCEVLLLSREHMQMGYDKHHSWERFGRLIAENIFVGVSQRRDSLLYKSPEERYLELFEQRPKVVAQMSQQHIASYLGMTPESLSRIRKRIAQKD